VASHPLQAKLENAWQELAEKPLMREEVYKLLPLKLDRLWPEKVDSHAENSAEKSAKKGAVPQTLVLACSSPLSE
jgi:hypothetical protein